jgi:hypothetical protein
MSDDSNALVALKNAWTGAVAASDQVREFAPSVLGLTDASSLADIDLDACHRVTLAQSNAVMALRGLVEQLRRKREQDSGSGGAAPSPPHP